MKVESIGQNIRKFRKQKEAAPGRLGRNDWLEPELCRRFGKR